MKNWNEHYVKQENITGTWGDSWDDNTEPYSKISPKDEHLSDLIDEHLKMFKEFPKWKPWMWPIWMHRYDKLSDEIQNHKKHYPEYYL